MNPFVVEPILEETEANLEDKAYCSEDEGPVYLEFNETSFAQFFSHIEKSEDRALKTVLGEKELTLRGFSIPPEIAAKHVDSANPEGWWRVELSGSIVKRFTDHLSSTPLIPSGNCWYNSLLNSIQCRPYYGNYWGDERCLSSDEVKTLLKQFFDEIPVNIADKNRRQ